MSAFISSIISSKFGQSVSVAGAYYLVGRFCLLLAEQTTNATAIWPPTGIALAAVLLYGCRIWPAIALGAFFSNLDTFISLTLSTPIAIAAAFITAMGNALGALASGSLVVRFTEGRNPFNRTIDMAKFMLFGALIGPNASAIIGSITLSILHGMWGDSTMIWFTWWLGDAVAILIMTPLIMTWEMRLKSFWTPLKMTEAVILLALLVSVGWVVFIKGLTLPYLFIPILIWAAFRFGKFESAFLIFLMLCLSIWGSTEGVFIYHNVSPKSSLLLTQVFISIVSVMSMLLSSLLLERDTALADFGRTNGDLQHEISVRRQAEEERRKLEEQLQRAEKMQALGTLAGGVAHDLNNILGVVIGYSELLTYASNDPDRMKSLATKILKAGQKAAAVVQDLLTLARRGIQDRKVLNLKKILLEIQESPEFAKTLGHDPEITVNAEHETDLLNISGSSVHLEKSIMNLILNAVEAMPDGGVITIRAFNRYLDRPVSGYDSVMEGDYVVLSVSDSGVGISAKDLNRIFEPFYTKKVMGRSGTGLGLAVVWGTIKDHGGYINVESDEEKGTTFTLYFPVVRADIVIEQDSVSVAEYMGNGESILIVDDILEQRELASMMLTKLNYNVASVASGEEAVEYVRQNAVDLIVLDMIMNTGMDGLDTYSKLLEIHPRQKAIIVSGFSETERVTKAQALGAGPYLKKPYMLEKLGLTVKKELNRAA